MSLLDKLKSSDYEYIVKLKEELLEKEIYPLIKNTQNSNPDEYFLAALKMNSIRINFNLNHGTYPKSWDDMKKQLEDRCNELREKSGYEKIDFNGKINH